MNRRKFFKSLLMLAAVPVVAKVAKVAKLLPENDYCITPDGLGGGVIPRYNPGILSDEDMFEARLRRGEVIQDENFEFKRTIDLNAGDRYLVQYCSFKVSTGGDFHPGFYADLNKPMGTFTYNYIYT